jgi:hypothetical protein
MIEFFSPVLNLPIAALLLERIIKPKNFKAITLTIVAFRRKHALSAALEKE